MSCDRTPLPAAAQEEHAGELTGIMWPRSVASALRDAGAAGSLAAAGASSARVTECSSRGLSSRATGACGRAPPRVSAAHSSPGQGGRLCAAELAAQPGSKLGLQGIG